jgi:hypothetical protein
MGMFDNLYCKVPLPGDHPFDAGTCFQTKAFEDPFMETYVIEEDGRLMHLAGYYESVPECERPYPGEPGIKGLIGCIKFVETGWEHVDCHQRVKFYSDANGKWYDFVATFTHGQLESLELVNVEDLPKRIPLPEIPE